MTIPAVLSLIVIKLLIGVAVKEIDVDIQGGAVAIVIILAPGDLAQIVNLQAANIFIISSVGG